MSDIMVSLGLKDESFSKAMKTIDKELKTLDNTLSTLNSGVEGFENDLEKLAMVEQATAKKMELLTAKLELQKKEFEKNEKQISEYRKELEKVDDSTDEGARKSEELAKAIAKAEKAQASLGNQIDNTNAKIKAFSSSIEKTSTASDETANSINEIDKELKVIDSTLKNLRVKELGDDLESLALIEQQTARQSELLANKLELQQQKYDGLENEITELKNKLKTLDSATEEGARSTEELTREIKALEQAQNILQSEIAQTTSKIKALDTALDNVDDSTSEASTGIKAFANNLKAMNLSEIGQGLIELGNEMVQLGQKGLDAFTNLVMAGSEYSATQEQINMLYKNQGKLTQQAINNQMMLASQYGLTETQVKGATSELASYFKAMGMTDEATAQLIESNTKLIADMAAYANVPFEQALSDVKSALMGNHNAVDKYSIALSETTMTESEYVKLLGKKFSDLTEEEKLLARLSVMQKQSADYAGLAAQESESFTSQLNLLKASISETAGEIGMNLLPVLQPLLENILGIVQRISEWAEQNPQLATTIVAVVGALSAFAVVLGTLAAGIGTIYLLTAACTALGLSFGWVTVIVVAVAALIAAIVALWVNWDQVSAWIAEKWQWLCDKTVEICQNIKDWAIEKWNAMCDWITSKLEQFKGWVSDKFNAIKDWVIDKWTTMKDTVVQKTSELVEKVKAFFDNFWYNLGVILGQCLRAIVDFCVDQYNQFMEWIPKAVEAVGQWFSDMKTKVGDWLKQTWQKVVEFCQDQYQTFQEFIPQAVEFVKTKFQEMKEKVKDWLDKTIETIKTWAKDLLPKAKEAGQNMINGLKEKLAELPSKMKTWATDAVNAFIDGIKAKIGAAKNALASLWSGVTAGWGGGGDGGAAPYATRSIDIPVNYETRGLDYIIPENLLVSSSAYAIPDTIESRALVTNYQNVLSGGGSINKAMNGNDVLGDKLDSLTNSLNQLINGLNQQQTNNSLIISVEQMNVRNENDIRNLAKELDSLRKLQQMGKGQC